RFAFHFGRGFAGGQTGLGGQNDPADNLVGGRLVSIQPGFQSRTNPIADGGRHFRIVQLFFRLALKHRLLDEYREDTNDALADILGADVEALDLHVMGGNVVANRLGNTALEAALMRSAGAGADAVDVGADGLLG